MLCGLNMTDQLALCVLKHRLVETAGQWVTVNKPLLGWGMCVYA